MKKQYALLIVFIVTLCMITGCQKYLKYTFKYDVATGDRIEVKYKTFGKYTKFTNKPENEADTFDINNKNEVGMSCRFLYEDEIEIVANALGETEGSELLKEDSKDGNDYIFYHLDNEEYEEEYGYVMKIKDSNTGVLLYSNTMSQKDAEECFKNLTFSCE